MIVNPDDTSQYLSNVEGKSWTSDPNEAKVFESKSQADWSLGALKGFISGVVHKIQ